LKNNVPALLVAHLLLSFGLSLTSPLGWAESPEALDRSQVETILTSFAKWPVSLISDSDLHGQRAYVEGDFNGDGHLDVAMTAFDPYKKNTFFVIATKVQNKWKDVFSIPLPGRPVPYVQFGGMDQRLEIGSLHSDKQPITIFWDTASKKYAQSSADIN